MLTVCTQILFLNTDNWMGTNLIKKLYKISYFLFLLNAFLILLVTSLRAGAVESFDPNLEEILTFSGSQSNWHEYNKNTYQHFLSSVKFDILVVPFQVRDHGIDRIGRSLMSRYLIDVIITTNPVARIPQIEYVEKALGANKRRYSEKDIFQLANKAKVNQIIVGYVGHDNNKNMSLTIRVYSLSENESYFSNSTKYTQNDWNGIPFDDINLPSLAFKKILPEITQTAKFPDKVNRPKVKKYTINLKLPVTLDNIIKPKRNLNALETAYSLQFVGMLYPRQSFRRRETMFEKSLLALSHVSPDSEYYEFLTARAYYYLHRRPAAIAALEHSNETNTKKYMQSLLDGNLPEIQKFSKSFQKKMDRIVAAIEITDVTYMYGGEVKEKEIIDYEKFSEEWAYFIGRRLTDRNDWNVESNLRAKLILDEKYPIPGKSAAIYLKGKLAEGNLDISNDVDLSVVEHVYETLARKGKELCCGYIHWGLQPIDYLYLIEGIGESNLLKKLYKVAVLQERTEIAKQLLANINTIYSGHPQFTNLEVVVSTMGYDRAGGAAKSQMLTKQHTLINQLFSWSNGQVFYTRSRLKKVKEINKDKTLTVKRINNVRQITLTPLGYKSLYITDFPHRSFWPVLNETEPKLKKELVSHNVRYSTNNIDPIRNLVDFNDVDSKDEAFEVLEKRFIGNPYRLNILAKLNKEKFGIESAISVYEEAVKSRDKSWAPYEYLGFYYVQEGDYQSASETFLKYPLFESKRSTAAVEISNRASQAGNILYWRGETERAEKLLDIAARTNAGSLAQYNSVSKLAILRQDYKEAIEFSLQGARRYNDVYAYRDAISMLHVIGENQAAWDIFNSQQSRLVDLPIWDSVFVGHRIQQTAVSEIVKWLKQPNLASLSKNYIPLSVRYAFMAFTTDRPATEEYREAIINVSRAVSTDSSKVFDDYIRLYYAIKSGNKSELEAVIRTGVLGNQLYTTKGDDGYWGVYTTWYQLFSSKLAKGPAVVKAVQNNLQFLKRKLDEDELKAGYGLWDQRTNYYLMTAILNAYNNEDKAAIRDLNHAFNNRSHSPERFQYSWYQLVEIAEWLYKERKQKEYLELALNWSQKLQRVAPYYAWPFAFEAKYGEDNQKKLRSLAIALYLDPKSEWISGISDNEKQEARIWLQQKNPYMKHKNLNQV